MDRVMFGTTEAVSKEKSVRKVDPSILALLGRPPFKISEDLVVGMIEGACQNKALLAK